jgi:major outer membrane protein
MNLLKKTTPWLAGLLTLASSAVADDNACRAPQRKSFEQAQRVTKMQMPPAYNAPSRIDVRGSWDLYMTGSFVYWQLSQDNMEVALNDTLTNVNYTTNNQIKGELVRMDFDYKPGFKVGLGMNLDQDDWDVFAEYTRLHASNSASANGTDIVPGGVPGPIFPTWGHPYVIQTNVYNTASEKWDSNLDAINLDLGRAYYVGTQLTFRPFFGLRSLFLTQSVHAEYVNTSFTNTLGSFVEIPGVLDVVQRNRSWSIGPRVGVDTHWALGMGVRLFGNANADVLYTKYKIQNKTNFQVNSGADGFTTGQTLFHISKERVPALRGHTELEMGLGWGSYFDNNNWHIDLSAAYGFQIFFDQNMLTKHMNGFMTGKLEQPSGNLYAQGVTATARFDF